MHKLLVSYPGAIFLLTMPKYEAKSQCFTRRSPQVLADIRTWGLYIRIWRVHTLRGRISECLQNIT